MAGEENGGKSGGLEISTTAPGSSLSGEFPLNGAPGDSKDPVVGDGFGTGGVEFNPDGTVSTTEDTDPGTDKDKPEGDAAPEDADKADTEDADKEDADTEEDADKADTEASDEALPEFDPENEEVVSKWDAKYFPGDGNKLDTTAFRAEVLANRAKTNEAGERIGKDELNADSYKYLEHRLGVDKETVDAIIEGEALKEAANETKFYKLTSGHDDASGAPFDQAAAKASYDAKVEWGSAHYTPKQKERFNAALKSGDPEIIKEQIDLLTTRMAAAGDLPRPRPTNFRKGRPEPQRRPSSPARPAGGAPSGGPGGGTDVFETNDQYLAAVKAAGKDEAKVAEVRAKLQRSTFWRTKR